VLFQAFQQPDAGRGRWALLALPAVGLALWLVARSGESPHQGPRAWGIQSVRQGMTTQEVSGLLGKPMAVEPGRNGRGECYQYGHPTLEKAEFPVYSLCYEDGRLRDVTVRRYTSLPVGPEELPSLPATGRAP
jgi:hypothetical protein